MTDVKLIARWTGWCDPCEVERPLMLTETGERGLRAWLRGIGHEDRAMTLTCRVCGEWQDVPHDEDYVDEPTPALTASPVTLLVLGTRQVVVRPARSLPPVVATAAVAPVPTPRARVDVHVDGDAHVLELLSEGLDLITLAG